MKRRLFAPDRDKGFVLIFVAVALVALLLSSGLCLDLGRAYLVKAQLSKAVDAAALGAARSLNAGDPKGAAIAIFRANFKLRYMGTLADPSLAGDFYSLTTNQATGTNIIQIRATAVMPTTLMGMANIPSVTVSSFGEATRRMVDLCLVLDVSGSIGAAWPAVRDAARGFVNAFDAATDRFCLVRYSSGADVFATLSNTRGFNKTAVTAAIPQYLPGGGTLMAEGLYRGWDELRAVTKGQQSSLRVIVLFTDGASNGVPGFFDSTTVAKTLMTSDFPNNYPDPGNQTSDNATIYGLYNTKTGAQSPSYQDSFFWKDTSTLTPTAVAFLPATSAHTWHRSVGIPTAYPLESTSLYVNKVRQDTARKLRNYNSYRQRYPADVWNVNNAARNLVEIIANDIRDDSSGDYDIRIYTIGMGALVRYLLGTIPETSQDILTRVANDVDSLDYKSTQIAGKYFYAAGADDVAPAFQELQNQIIRLTR